MTTDMKGWCSTCQNTGFVNCYCGGDQCVCENNGEMECPDCWGTMADDDFPDGGEWPEYGGPQDWPSEENVP